MSTNQDPFFEKKDLHVGGLGSSTAAGPAYLTDSFIEEADTWIQRAREVLSDADDYVRENPWRVIGISTLLGFAAGLIVSRRF